MKLTTAFWTTILFASLLLAGCRMPAPPTPTKADPNALFTAAALTAEARRLLRVGSSPTPLPPEAGTSTPTAQLAEATPTGPLQATVIVPTVDTSQPAEDKAEFVQDVTVPDGEAHGPNRSFVKTWRLLNAGLTTWNTSYSLVFVSGSLMGGPGEIPLPGEVAPGETTDVSIELVAPAEAGIYQSLWKLRNDKDQLFGVGAAASDPIWVIISVVSGAGEGTPTAGPASGEVISNLTVSVAPPSFTGSCPKTFTFTVTFSLISPSTVTYGLEAGGDTGVEIKLPPPATRNLAAGDHSTVYELTFSSSLNGWVRVRFLDPEVVISRAVNFTLVCQ